MKERNTTCLREEWEQMPTEQLDELLQAELRKENPEEEVVLPILKIIEEREKDYQAEVTEDTSAAWEKYQEHISVPKKPERKRAWILSTAAVAAVLCVVFMAVPKTVGAESIFDVLFRWTESVFEFFDPDMDGALPQLEQEFVTDNPGLQQLHDKLKELGVTEPVVPMWLPLECELRELKVTPMPDGSKVRALFMDGKATVSLSYWISAEATMQYEKENVAVEVFESAGMKHFIMENEGNLFVTWVISGAECAITANIEKEAVYKMIQSIYRRDLE